MKIGLCEILCMKIGLSSTSYELAVPSVSTNVSGIRKIFFTDPDPDFSDPDPTCLSVVVKKNNFLTQYFFKKVVIKANKLYW
jgi:hypothetical protein